MKVKSSKYLKEIKPLLVHLRDRLLEDYSYVSILATDSVGKHYSVSKDITSVGMISWMTGQGFVVKVYDGASYGEYSFNEISEDEIEKIVSKIKGELFPISESLPDGVKKSVYAMLEDTPMVFEDSTEYEIDPQEYGDEAIIQELAKTSESGRAYSDKVLDCRAFAQYQKYSKLFLSKNRDMEQNVLWTVGGFGVVASRGEELKDSYHSFSKLGGAELLVNMSERIGDTAKTAL